MSEIIIRTDKSEYTSGEHVFGAVYLRVDSPTAGSGVRIKFIGQESYRCSVATSGQRAVNHGSIDYLSGQPVDLYEFPGPIALGSYVFPFSVHLPPNLPGSMSAMSQEPGLWTLQVCYQIQAEVIGSESVMTQHLLLVHQDIHTQQGIKDNYVTKSCRVGRILRGEVAVSARLDKHIYRFGESAKLNLYFNSTGIVMTKVKAIMIKLNRELTVVFRKQRSSGQASPEGATGSPELRLDGIKLDGGPTEVWGFRTTDVGQINLSKGLQNIFIPLRSNEGDVKLPPTTHGTFLKCHYQVDVDLQLEGASILLSIPVPFIRAPPNTQWKLWSAPDWTNHSHIKMREGPYAVSWDVLASGVYYHLPGFRTQRKDSDATLEDSDEEDGVMKNV